MHLEKKKKTNSSVTATDIQ